MQIILPILLITAVAILKWHLPHAAPLSGTQVGRWCSLPQFAKRRAGTLYGAVRLHVRLLALMH